MVNRLSNEDIIETAHNSDVEFIRFQFTDIFGVMKNVAITVEELEKALYSGIIFDGSSIDGPVRTEERDMYLKPDPSTFTIYPWRTSSGLDARIICDVYTLDKKPFEGDPRFVLRKVLREAEDLGYTMKASPECEFYLFNTDEKGRPTTVTHDNAGYYDLAPVDLGEAARREMAIALKQMGLKIDASHHEIAPGQHELDLKYEDALYTADNIMTLKAIVRIIAQRHGLHATFMPKPVYGIAGSGMHVNISLYKDGRNSFHDDNDKNQLSEDAYYFMGGLLKHSRALTAVANPIVNSYKRLVSGYDAPQSITWSSNDSSSFVKIPSKGGLPASLELRSPDPSCNPYLTLALILKAGLDGIENKISPQNPIDGSAVKTGKANAGSLPTSLTEALSDLEEDGLMKDTLGRYAYSRFIQAKNSEWQEYRKTVSAWEIDQYLTRF